MDSKLALSAEIATYRRLLMAEENRSREGMEDAAAPAAYVTPAASASGKGPAPAPPKGQPVAPTK